MVYRTTHPSPLGLLTLACDGQSLTGLWMEGQKHFGEAVPAEAIARDDLPVFRAAKSWLDRYFAGEKPEASQLPLRPMGGEFSMGVWRILRGIPCGGVATYGEIAGKAAALLGRKTMSSQAVGGAVGRNPISIIIPCHRVVGADGSLTGYSGGLHRKARLLELEGADMSRLLTPISEPAPQR